MNISQMNQSFLNQSEKAIPLDIAVIGEENSGKKFFLSYFKKDPENLIINLKNQQKYKINFLDGSGINIKQKLACKGYILIIHSLELEASSILKSYLKHIYEYNGNNPKTKKRIYIIINMNAGIDELNYKEIFEICN